MKNLAVGKATLQSRLRPRFICHACCMLEHQCRHYIKYKTLVLEYRAHVEDLNCELDISVFRYYIYGVYSQYLVRSLNQQVTVFILAATTPLSSATWTRNLN